ncbi:hypothetical protein BJ944DRAFT_268789 [Cunninghamella echinulata]|nr:hypothetical protein BJ944DRAFT_268789 [Cunninghamella echinulata]
MLVKLKAITTDSLQKYIRKYPYAISKQVAFTLKAYQWTNTPKNLNSEEDFRTTFIVTKKAVSKSACIRDRCKRRVRDAVRQVFTAQAPKGFDYILFVYAPAYNMDWKELYKSVEDAVKITQNVKMKKSK